jgi:hypothetical protein
MNILHKRHEKKLLAAFTGYYLVKTLISSVIFAPLPP